jgi:hypothetical protein
MALILLESGDGTSQGVRFQNAAVARPWSVRSKEIALMATDLDSCTPPPYKSPNWRKKTNEGGQGASTSRLTFLDGARLMGRMGGR